MSKERQPLYSNWHHKQLTAVARLILRAAANKLSMYHSNSQRRLYHAAGLPMCNITHGCLLAPQSHLH
jgi:hypothetical protein